MSSGRFDSVSLNDMCKLLLSEPQLSYADALQQVGSVNMPRIYDIAMIKRFFYDKERVSVLEKSGVMFWAVGLEFKKQEIAGTMVAVASHLSSPDVRYMWTGEYLGPAPPDHPAEGNLILARIDRMDFEKHVQLPLSFLQGTVPGQPVPSKERFALLDSIAGFKYQCVHGQMDCGYILDFVEVDGLMVPITSGERAAWKYDAKKDPHGYGTLFVDPSYGPMSCRPASWNPGLIFNNCSPVQSPFLVVRKQSLEELIQYSGQRGD